MKRIVTLFLVFVMVFGCVVPAYAADNEPTTIDISEINSLISQYSLSERLRDAKLQVIDSAVSQEVQSSISVSASRSPDSDECDDLTSYSVRNLGLVTEGDKCIGTLYTVTSVLGTQKTTDGSTTEDGVYAWLAVTWIDNFGIDNELLAVDGGWVPNGRTLTNRLVSYGVNGSNTYQYPSGNSFSYGNIGSVGLTISASSYVKSSGYNSIIAVHVTPTIIS